MISQPRNDFQFVALFLVVFGSMLTWVACHFNFPELKTLGASVAGAGIQSIVSQTRNILNNRDGGVINNTTEASTPLAGATT